MSSRESEPPRDAYSFTKSKKNHMLALLSQLAAANDEGTPDCA
jgi:hypothetical protein